MCTKTGRILFSILAVTSIVVRGKYPGLISEDAVTLALFVLAVIPWLPSFIDTAELPGGWKVSFKGLEAKQEEQQRRLDSLTFLIMNFVTEHELRHLQKLDNGDDLFEYDKKLRFISELRRLRDLGLIVKTSTTALGDIPDHGILRKYVKITESGRGYLDLRKKMMCELTSEATT